MTQAIEAPLAGTTVRSADRRRWLVLGAMVFGLFMPMLDNLIVNVALPTIRRELDASVAGLQWLVDAYILALAAAMLTGGALGDLYGRKRFFMWGLVIFAGASLLCGLSSSTSQLIAFRALQGVGAALLLPCSLSIITATFQGGERGAAIGIWAAFSGLAVAIGPIVGGYLVEHFSWQSVFFVNVPVGVLGLLITALVVPESKDASASRRVDVPGMATGTPAVFFLVYALIEGNVRGWTDGAILASFALSALCLAAFLRIESRSDSPMLPLAFFRIPTFSAANVVAAAVFFAMFGTTFFLTLYLQNVEGYSPAGAGIRLFPFTAMILVVAPVSGRLSDRFGSRWLMAVGTLTAAVGMALLTRTEPGSSYATVLLPAFVILGTGMATTMAPMTSAVMGSVHPRHAGVASAATNTSRQVGGVLGIAVLGAVVTSAFRRGFVARLVAAGLPAGEAADVAAEAGSRATTGEAAGATAPLVAAVHDAFVHAIHVGMAVGVGLLLFASLVSALFVRSHLETAKALAPGGRDGG